MLDFLKKTFLTPSPYVSEKGKKWELRGRKLVLAMFALFFIAYLVLQLATAHRKDAFNDDLTKAVQQMNASMPATLNSTLRMDEVALRSPTEVQYTATLLNVVKADIDVEKFKPSAIDLVVKMVKGNAALRPYAEHNVTLSYLLKDKTGVDITKIDVTPDMYR